MMYKDKDKQREAQRDWVRQKRALKGSTKQGSTLVGKDVLNPVTQLCNDQSFPKTTRFPTLKRGKDIKCFADLPPDIQKTIDMMSLVDGKIDKTIKANRTAIAVNYQHLFSGQFEPHWFAAAMSVTGKPGDADYNGVCTEEWRAERGR